MRELHKWTWFIGFVVAACQADDQQQQPEALVLALSSGRPPQHGQVTTIADDPRFQVLRHSGKEAEDHAQGQRTCGDIAPSSDLKNAPQEANEQPQPSDDLRHQMSRNEKEIPYPAPAHFLATYRSFRRSVDSVTLAKYERFEAEWEKRETDLVGATPEHLESERAALKNRLVGKRN